MEREALEANNGGGGLKRKIEDEIELAKQKAQAIAARILSDADAKRPRTSFESSAPPSSFSSQPSFPVSYATQASQYNGVPSSKKIVVPNAKVGVIIGRAGDMIKSLQQRSGAKIQITRDADADRSSLTRDVELVGTQEQISRAEELINEVIAETDAASSASSGNRGVASLPPGSEQFAMKVPNDRVALVIGKGGETIKSMQGKSGARIQIVPLHLPPGDTSTERNVFVSGTQEQIEAAKELINEVISGNRMKVSSGSNPYAQSAYPPSTGWAPQGQPPAPQPPAYGYTQPGAYSMPPPSYYGGYPPQSTGWEQQTNPAPQSQQPSTGYNAYGQQAPPTSAPPNANYNYGQVPPASSYNYNQGYTQQPTSYGQDGSGQAPAPDGSATTQTSQPGYGPPSVAQTSQPQPGYGTPPTQTSQPGYGTPSAPNSQPGYQATAASANGYGAYSSYSGTGAPPAQPAYSQTGYTQMGYGQQQEGQASYSYYGQGGYPPAQAHAQSSYYQGAPQGQANNGAPPQSSYGGERADGGDLTTTGSGGAAPPAGESEKAQS